MAVIRNNTLGRKERLKSHKLITELFKSGKAFNYFPFRVVYSVSNGTGAAQAGFSVSTRNFKRAVDRNRIKRLMREAYRVRKTTLTETLRKNNKSLVFFLIFTGKELPNQELIGAKIEVAIGKLINLLDEQAA